MAITDFIALDRIDAAQKVRLLVYVAGQGERVAHAPLTSLVRSALVRSGGEGWRQYGDGTLVQWGQGSGVDPQITFPRPFPQLCWHVSLTNLQTAGENRLVVRSAIELTPASFIAEGRFIDFSGSGAIVTGGQALSGFGWMAFGM